jgi:hypothetical protein
MKRSFRTRNSYFWVFAVLVLVALISGAAYQYGTEKEVTITIQDKERIVKGSGDGLESYYLIFTENGTYKNEDTFLYLKFRSSDLQGKLQVGETYKVKVYGWRIGLFSTYPNIVKIVK